MGVILHSDTAKQRIAVGGHNFHFRNSNATCLHQYSHDRMSPTVAELLSTASSHLILRPSN